MVYVDMDPVAVSEGLEILKGYERQTTTPFRMRSPAEIESFFDGYDLVEPGLAWASEWRPVDSDPDDFAGAPSTSAIMAAVGKRR